MAPSRANLAKHLKPHSHTPAELLILVAEESSKRGSDLSDVQRQAITRFHPDPNPNVTKKAFLNNMLTVFDDLFFGSNLAAVTTIHCVAEKVSERGIEGTACLNWITGRMRIQIWIQDRIENPIMRFWAYAGVLLHETVHCYLWLYLSRKYQNPFKVPLELRGKTGHGYLFQDLAYITVWAFFEMTGMEICLGRQRSLVRELSYWPKDFARVDVESRWGMDPALLEYVVVKTFRDRTSLRVKAVKRQLLKLRGLWRGSNRIQSLDHVFDQDADAKEILLINRMVLV